MAYTHAQHEAQAGSAPETIVLASSSFLQSATYDPQTFSLTLDFKNGTQSRHWPFYPSVWQQFKEQPSHGSFYARVIKKQYPGFPVKSGLKVSDLKRAIKEKRPNANKHAPATRKKAH